MFRLRNMFCALAMTMSDQVSKGHLVDALACTGDEGRGTLRKAAGSCEQALIRGCPNGETRLFESSYTEYIDMRSEPGELKHLSSQRKGNQPRLR